MLAKDVRDTIHRVHNLVHRNKEVKYIHDEEE